MSKLNLIRSRQPRRGKLANSEGLYRRHLEKPPFLMGGKRCSVRRASNLTVWKHCVSAFIHILTFTDLYLLPLAKYCIDCKTPKMPVDVCELSLICSTQLPQESWHFSSPRKPHKCATCSKTCSAKSTNYLAAPHSQKYCSFRNKSRKPFSVSAFFDARS